MERRLLTFIVASTAFFIFYFTLRSLFVEPQQVADQPPAAEVQDGQAEDPATGDDAPKVDGEAGEASEPESTDAESTDAESSDAEPTDAESDSKPNESAPERPEKSEWVTLGSMDSSSGYFMLVTLNSKGAGVERIELTERDDKGGFKYRRVDVRTGYLGYFAGENSSVSDGVIVNVVGQGTPAAIAGVQVNDVIVGINGSAVASREDLEAHLSKTEPGQSISVEITRGGASQTLQADLTNHPLDLIRLAKDGGPDQIAGNLSRLSCLMTLSQVNRKGIAAGDVSMPGVANPMELIWDSTSSQSDTAASATFTVELSDAEMESVGGDAVRIERSYSLSPSSYAIDLGIQIDNLSDEEQDLAFRLEGMNGVTLEGWWYSTKISPNFSGAAARDIVYKTSADGHELISGFTLLKAAKKETDTSANPALPRFDVTPALFASDGDGRSRDMKYIGVDAQYFTVAYVPPEGQGSFTTFRRASAGIASDPSSVPRHQERAVNSTFYLNSDIATVPAGKSMRQELRLFAGPKQPELLATYGLGDCIYYGWFSLFAKLLASLLHMLSAVGNYALAIILLTVLVRGCMFPLSRKAAVNAQKMQELAPELKKINDQY
ncbi:MAG: YidC/Oxa1 family insertase periplasmic-domain containing protein, partial [Rubripirellula sp.]